MYGVPRGINPDVPGKYLMQALWDVGPSRFDGTIETAIGWQDLAAYAKVMGTLSEPWEINAVMQMSKAYVREKTTSTDPLSIAPVDREAMNG